MRNLVRLLALATGVVSFASPALASWDGCLRATMSEPVIFSPDSSAFLIHDASKEQQQLLMAGERFFLLKFPKGKPASAAVNTGETTLKLGWNGKKLGLQQGAAKGTVVHASEVSESALAEAAAYAIEEKFVNSKKKKRKPGDPMPTELQGCYDTENVLVRKVIDRAYPSSDAAVKAK